MYLHMGMVKIGENYRGLMDMYIFIWQNTF